MRIGVLVPFTNTVLERDLEALRPPGSTTYVTRVGGYDDERLPDAAAMKSMGNASIDNALALLAGVRPDVVLYGCTSATLTHGLDFDAELRGHIETATGAQAITAAGAMIFALRDLGVKKVSFASPYTRDVADEGIAFLASAGIETVASAIPGGTVMSHDQGAMTPDEVFELASAADHNDAEAIVLSCTDLRAVEATQRIEAELQKPVVAVNQAMFTELAALEG